MIEFIPYSTSYGHTLVRNGETIADVEYVDEVNDAVIVTMRDETHHSRTFATLEEAIAALS